MSFLPFLFEGSIRGSNNNSPLPPRPVTYMARSGQFRTTPTLHLQPPLANNSPHNQQRVIASINAGNSSPEMNRPALYPRLTGRLVMVLLKQKLIVSCLLAFS